MLRTCLTFFKLNSSHKLKPIILENEARWVRRQKRRRPRDLQSGHLQEHANWSFVQRLGHLELGDREAGSREVQTSQGDALWKLTQFEVAPRLITSHVETWKKKTGPWENHPQIFPVTENLHVCGSAGEGVGGKLLDQLLKG